MCQEGNGLCEGGEFIEQNRVRMERTARDELRDKRCADPEGHAPDIVSEVSIILCIKWLTLRSPEDAMYVYTVNKASTHARSCRREFAAEIQDHQIPVFSQPGRDPEQMIHEMEFISWIKSVLTDDEFAVLGMRLMYDISFASIAERLKKPLGTVTSSYSRSLKKLRKSLKAATAHAPVIEPGTST